MTTFAIEILRYALRHARVRQVGQNYNVCQGVLRRGIPPVTGDLRVCFDGLSGTDPGAHIEIVAFVTVSRIADEGLLRILADIDDIVRAFLGAQPATGQTELLIYLL